MADKSFRTVVVFTLVYGVFAGGMLALQARSPAPVRTASATASVEIPASPVRWTSRLDLAAAE
jgi:hypothetical protein